MDNKKKLLTVLLFVLAALLVYRLMNPFRQQRVDQLTYTGKGAGASRSVNSQNSPMGLPQEADFLLGLLQTPPERSGRVTNPGFWGPGERPPQDESVSPETTPDSDAGADLANATLDPMLQVKQDLGQFRIFGFFKSRGELALFMERGKEILVVRKGDRIDGVYLVADITPQVLTIRAENIDEAVHIDLGEF